MASVSTHLGRLRQESSQAKADLDYLVRPCRQTHNLSPTPTPSSTATRSQGSVPGAEAFPGQLRELSGNVGVVSVGNETHIHTQQKTSADNLTSTMNTQCAATSPA